ncbi:spore germination protein [Neobacillus dielmonensis]|uniref:spore germination protein n=1 Tax=Neobacillus dielmonensis TaxID=1347369 RepID=UPI0005A687B2|nr:spore germination protein [Neobacillus dielmonensis]
MANESEPKSFQINISNIQVNGLAQNANINFGATVQNSHTSNLKFFGTNFSAGDGSPAASSMNTKVNENITNDQGQIDNVSET